MIKRRDWNLILMLDLRSLEQHNDNGYDIYCCENLFYFTL